MGFSKERLARLHDVMAGYVARGELTGLVALVSRHGETHVETLGAHEGHPDRPMRRDTVFPIASLTKPVTAVAAMTLLEECRLRLDDPVDELLPELAGRRVLARPDGPLDDTVPARRSITLRDLLTFRMGIGAVMDGPSPIARAIAEAGVGPGPVPAAFGHDEWLARLGALPLVHQPGEVWMYHTASDVLGVLIARATGRGLGDVLRERIFEPLGMRDTGFHVPAPAHDRLAAGDADEPADSRWARPPVFEAAGGGLLSTVDDYLAFCRMLLGSGGPVLSRPSVELMTTDHLTPQQRRLAGAEIFFGDCVSWGLGLAVDIRREELWRVPGRFGWDGGSGVTAWSDPKEDLVTILMTQRPMTSPRPPAHYRDFYTCAYQALDG